MSFPKFVVVYQILVGDRTSRKTRTVVARNPEEAKATVMRECLNPGSTGCIIRVTELWENK
jgi:hypothetical protein